MKLLTLFAFGVAWAHAFSFSAYSMAQYMSV